MTRISRIRVDPRHMGFFLHNFWNLITLLEDKDQVKNFLKDLLTPTEMKMLAKRIQIAKMLLGEYDYRSIRNYVKVTDTTIAKINNILASNGNGLRIAISELRKIEDEIDKERMQIAPNLKKKYPTYFLPEIIINEIGKKVKKQKKRSSVKNSITRL
ncbi:hypothetical protein HYT17_02675 [Candidatus Microgenomates bacterium]|nr:hypothetical protein [Candidatus Microgenomates bacterium]